MTTPQTEKRTNSQCRQMIKTQDNGRPALSQCKLIEGHSGPHTTQGTFPHPDLENNLDSPHGGDVQVNIIQDRTPAGNGSLDPNLVGSTPTESTPLEEESVAAVHFGYLRDSSSTLAATLDEASLSSVEGKTFEESAYDAYLKYWKPDGVSFNELCTDRLISWGHFAQAVADHAIAIYKNSLGDWVHKESLAQERETSRKLAEALKSARDFCPIAGQSRHLADVALAAFEMGHPRPTI